MHIVEYVKAHPWTVGTLVIGGGLTFILLSGWFKGGSNSTVIAASGGPSEAAQLAYANLQAQQQVSANQTGAQVAIAGIASDLQKYVAAAQANTAMSNIDAQKTVSLADITAGQNEFTIQNQTAVNVAQMQATTANLNITTAADLDKTQIKSTENIITSIIGAFAPKPAIPVTTVSPTPVAATRTATVSDFLAANGDIAKEYVRASSSGDKNSPIYKAEGLDSPDNYAMWHISHFDDTGRAALPGTQIHI